MPDSHITASSEYGTHDPKHDYSAARDRINNTETKNSQGVTQMGAWTADILDKNQYIRVKIIGDNILYLGCLKPYSRLL